MSRRFSDEPINLIQRIPSPEQISAARPSKRSWGQAFIETGAACIRGVAELVAQVRRLGRVVRSAVSSGAGSKDSSLGRMKERVGHGLRTFAASCARSYDGLADWIAKLDVTVQPFRPVSSFPSEIPAEAPPVASTVGSSTHLEELAELRTFILTQQEDISRLSSQLQELRSLVVSQEQVLVYLGKELESTHTQVPTMTAVASAPAVRNRVVREKPVAKEKAISRKGSHKPSLNL